MYRYKPFADGTPITLRGHTPHGVVEIQFVAEDFTLDVEDHDESFDAFDFGGDRHKSRFLHKNRTVTVRTEIQEVEGKFFTVRSFNESR